MKNFWLLFFQIFFHTIHPFGNSSYAYSRSLEVILQLNDPFFLISVLFWVVSTAKFFRFTDFFFCNFSYTANPIQCIFISDIVVSSPEVQFGFLISFMSLV